MLGTLAATDEVIRLHAFLESWFRGEVPKTQAIFARLSLAWPNEFTLVDPGNRVLKSVELLEQTFSEFGAYPHLRIEIRNMRVMPATSPAFAVVLYEEWHIDRQETEGRLCSATLALDAASASAVVWILIHESPIQPASGAASP